MSDMAVALPQSELQALRARGRVRGVLPLLGPAFVAAVAYIDPGNFATNIAGGAKYGYLLVWVIVAANLMAMLVQYLSAKTGIATGRNLPELCRDRFPRPVTWGSRWPKSGSDVRAESSGSLRGGHPKCNSEGREILQDVRA